MSQVPPSTTPLVDPGNPTVLGRTYWLFLSSLAGGGSGGGLSFDYQLPSGVTFEAGTDPMPAVTSGSILFGRIVQGPEAFSGTFGTGFMGFSPVTKTPNSASVYIAYGGADGNWYQIAFAGGIPT